MGKTDQNADTTAAVQVKRSLYSCCIKRLLDFVLSLCAVVMLSPVLLIVALLVRVKLGSPVLFKPRRPGLNEKIFTLYKFRTMNDKKDKNGHLLPDSERLTKFGRILRSTSLDELPELFNIIRGDMAVVGPRPLAEQYLPFYTTEERKRHSVRPGLAGLAQINGRNALGWEAKFAYDIEYANRVSFRLDVSLIWLTVKTVLKRSDIGERGVDSPIDFDVYRKNQTQQEGAEI